MVEKKVTTNNKNKLEKDKVINTDYLIYQNYINEYKKEKIIF